jgi:integrase
VKKKTDIFTLASANRRKITMKVPAKDTAPTIENFTVVRRYLTEREVDRLMNTARKVSRRGHRDATMILVAYRHGLRASEVCDLQWHQIELDQGRLYVRRAKRGMPSVHPIRGDEIRALRKLRRENPTEAYVFISERGGPMRTLGFHHLIARLGKAAKMPLPSIRTCCAMPAASSSPTMVMTRGPCSITSGTRTSNTRLDTPRWRPTGFEISGAKA